MIKPEELFNIEDDFVNSKMDLDLYFKFALLLQIEKLNFNLSQIDFSLRGLVGK